uniref:hypothetical protein n=1 Tax=Segatella hominis TaxID=2518605 RepID=UPI004029170A
MGILLTDKGKQLEQQVQYVTTPSARLLDGQISCCKGNNMNKASQGQWLASRHGVHMNRR